MRPQGINPFAALTPEALTEMQKEEQNTKEREDLMWEIHNHVSAIGSFADTELLGEVILHLRQCTLRAVQELPEPGEMSAQPPKPPRRY